MRWTQGDGHSEKRGTMRRHEASFDAIDEQGRRHRLHVYVDVLDVGTFGDPDATIDGLRSIETDDGDPVNSLGEGRYEIVTTGQIVTSSDPAAL